jgi:NAD(P)-dependent dehydrogenase (short-subunit alcohol dehydrogenase family)
MDLENKIVLVTGSSKGIGESIVKAFSKEKARAIITYNQDKEGAQNIAGECEKLGGKTSVLQLDVSSNDSILRAKSAVEEDFGHVDVLVNNAGVIAWERFEQETLEEIEKQVRVNLEGVIKTTSVFLPMIKEGIINISSRAGHIPYPGRATYSATKHGVIGFTKSLALEIPDLKIFSVSPGATKTEMWDFESGADPDKVAQLIVEAWKGEIELKDYDLPVWQIL